MHFFLRADQNVRGIQGYDSNAKILISTKAHSLTQMLTYAQIYISAQAHTCEHAVTLVCTQLLAYPFTHSYTYMRTATRIHMQSHPCMCAKQSHTQLHKASGHTEYFYQAVSGNSTRFSVSFCRMPSLPVHSQAVGLRITPTEPGIGCCAESRTGPYCAVTSSLGYGPASTFQQPTQNVRINLWGPVLIWEVDSQQTNHSQDLK